MKKKLKDFIIDKNSSLRNAMRQIQRNKKNIVFITEGKKSRVIASLTDGDLRRSLIKNSNLDRSVATCFNRKFKFIRANISVYEFLSIDNSFNKKTREIAFQKKDSYIYLLKKMILNFPHLKNNDEDLVLKSFFGHLKLLFIKIKNLL